MFNQKFPTTTIVLEAQGVKPLVSIKHMLIMGEFNLLLAMSMSMLVDHLHVRKVPYPIPHGNMESKTYHQPLSLTHILLMVGKKIVCPKTMVTAGMV
jgi:hypothetical protein